MGFQSCLRSRASWISAAIVMFGVGTPVRSHAQYPVASAGSYETPPGAAARSNATAQNLLPWMIMSGSIDPVNPGGMNAAGTNNPYGMTPQQMALYMMTVPGRAGGFGSGQLSGVRPGPATPGLRPSEEVPETKGPRMSNRPAGQAGRYFSRGPTAARSTPRGYYGRPNRYFP